MRCNALYLDIIHRPKIDSGSNGCKSMQVQVLLSAPKKKTTRSLVKWAFMWSFVLPGNYLREQGVASLRHYYDSCTSFQSMLPRRERPTVTRASIIEKLFQSTLPRRERPLLLR